MSDRGAEEAGTTGADGQERRAGGGHRVHFEALVAVGEMVGGGFEAESIDVSPEGMRLRTAYLPAIGDKLVCRFDGMGAEVVAEGEVIWKNQEARGGEFGLRFLDLDPDTAEAVRAMCGSLGGNEEEEAPAPEAPQVPRGARVRLHIEGLGSPMKARVREAAAKELEVGSNLEFLKVGRSLELEDVDQGKRREATIAHVKVDIDPVTNVPQLVVSLRYDREPSAEAGAIAPKTRSDRSDKSEKSASARISIAPPTRRASTTMASEKPPEARKSRPSLAELAADVTRAHDAESSADDESESESDAPPGVGARAASAGRAVAGKIGPALAGAGARAKGALGGLLAAVQKKRLERAEVIKVDAPRRTTAPAPGGALKSEGRRLVRDDGEDESNDEAPTPAMRGPRRAAVGAALGLIMVLAIFGVSRAMTSHGATAASAANADGTSASALPSPSGDPSALPAPPALPVAVAQNGAAGTPTANVPLFGATPLSTTEAVPAPAPSGAALAAAAPGDGADDGEDDAAPAAAGDGKSGPPLKEWGQGSVAHPVTLKLKMDGPIERINGAAGAMGFTISLPDRRSVSSTTDLARKDKRLSSVNVINTSHGAEVTLQFKDGVPPYLAKVKGDRLEIALGSEHGAKKVAKKKHTGDKSKAKTKKKSK
ncbi:MAG: PilZ domain-containing protein [Byssovorax sp.]